jgi:hypothetical protein
MQLDSARKKKRKKKKKTSEEEKEGIKKVVVRESCCIIALGEKRRYYVGICRRLMRRGKTKEKHKEYQPTSTTRSGRVWNSCVVFDWTILIADWTTAQAKTKMDGT